MSKLILLTVFALVVAAVFANDCEYKGVTLKNGEERSPIAGQCVRATCKNGKVSAIPCPLYGLPMGCNVKFQKLDLTKPYPSCCAKAYCDPS